MELKLELNNLYKNLIFEGKEYLKKIRNFSFEK